MFKLHIVKFISLQTTYSTILPVQDNRLYCFSSDLQALSLLLRARSALPSGSSRGQTLQEDHWSKRLCQWTRSMFEQLGFSTTHTHNAPKNNIPL